MSLFERQFTDILSPFLERSEAEVAKEIVFRQYTLRSKKIAGSNSITICHSADLHNRDPFTKHSDLHYKIKEKHPDIIVIAGDISHNGKFERSMDFIEKVSKIPNKPSDVFITLGNHDFKNINSNDLIKAIRQIGCRVLRNEYENINESITINGIDDPMSYTYDSSRNPLDEIEYTNYIYNKMLSEKFTISINHRTEKGYLSNSDLTLTGHAHGGQVRIFKQGLTAPHQPFLPRYTEGLYQFGDKVVISSSGLANTMKLPRINNPGTIDIVNLQAA